MYRDNAYYAPNIEIIEVKVEQGICQSNTPGYEEDNVTGGLQ